MSSVGPKPQKTIAGDEMHVSDCIKYQKRVACSALIPVWHSQEGCIVRYFIFDCELLIPCFVNSPCNIVKLGFFRLRLPNLVMNVLFRGKSEISYDHIRLEFSKSMITQAK